MISYSYNQLFNLVERYNNKHKTNVNVNELLEPNYGRIDKMGGIDKTKFGKYQPKVLYEDNDYFGIYKPPYWIVNVGNPNRDSWIIEKNMDKPFLQVWLHQNLEYPLKDSPETGYGICNRLDINTSGIVLVAKSKKNYKHLRKQINDHENTRKKYITIVQGIIEEETTIKTKINCVKVRFSNKCYNSYKGKYAKTRFIPISYFKDDQNNTYTLLDVKIYTGRTHQIRVHLRMLNTFIVSDNLYSPTKKRYQSNIRLFPRIFLHTYYYSFLNIEGQRINVFSGLPDDLYNSLDKLKLVDDELNKKELMEFLKNPKKIFDINKNK